MRPFTISRRVSMTSDNPSGKLQTPSLGERLKRLAGAGRDRQETEFLPAALEIVETPPSPAPRRSSSDSVRSSSASPPRSSPVAAARWTAFTMFA